MADREDVISLAEPVVDLDKVLPGAGTADVDADVVDEEPAAQLGARERHRIERTQEFLDTALRIVTSEGSW